MLHLKERYPKYQQLRLRLQTPDLTSACQAEPDVSRQTSVEAELGSGQDAYDGEELTEEYGTSPDSRT